MSTPPVSLDDGAQSGDFEDTFEHAVADMLDVPPEQVRLTACALLFGLLRRFSLSLAEPLRRFPEPQLAALILPSFPAVSS
jgi:hypothetical protein